MHSISPYLINGKRFFVAGHSGLLGSSICPALEGEDVEILTISHNELDLTRQSSVEEWIKINQPDVVIIAAAKIAETVNYDGEHVFESSKSDSAPRKVLDFSKLHKMRWMHKTSLKDGLDKTYNWYIENVL